MIEVAGRVLKAYDDVSGQLFLTLILIGYGFLLLAAPSIRIPSLTSCLRQEIMVEPGQSAVPRELFHAAVSRGVP